MQTRRIAIPAIALALALALPGCFSEILAPPPRTTLDFTCAILDPEMERITIQSWLEEGVSVDRGAALGALVLELQRITSRQAGDFTFSDHDLTDQGGAWTATKLREWADAQYFQRRGEVFLRVLWLNDLGDGADVAGVVAGPGAVAVSEAAILAAAQRLAQPSDVIARVVLLHEAGHALGVINQGIPVQDPEIQVREGPAGHEPDPASVMASGWDDARSMTWAENATYDSYSPALIGDWSAAREPGGVCAA